MSMHIAATVFWGGDIFFITDTDEVWRVWIGRDYFPMIGQMTSDPLGDYSWPIQELRKIKSGEITKTKLKSQENV